MSFTFNAIEGGGVRWSPSGGSPPGAQSSGYSYEAG